VPRPHRFQQHGWQIAILLASVLLPLLGMGLFKLWLPHWHWINHIAHSAVETLIAAALLAVGIFLLRLLPLVENEQEVRQQQWIAGAFVAMALLTGLHAVAHPNDLTFPWFLITSTIAGGLMLSGLWLPARLLPSRHALPVGIGVVGVASLFAVFSLLTPQAIPVLIEQDHFSPSARIYGTIAGASFLPAAAWFILRRRHAGSVDYLYFASASLLFSLSGFAFDLTNPWTAGWWYWHALRLGSALILLTHIIAISTKAASDTARAEILSRFVLDAAPSGMAMITEHGRISVVNRQLEEMFGYRREEMIGQPVEMLVPERFRVNHAAHIPSYAEKPSARPMSDRSDLTGQRKDGSEFPIEISLAPIHMNQGLRVLASVVDISERTASETALRKSAERLNLATATAQLGIWDWDIVNNELVWDDRMFELYGVRKEDFGGAYEAWLNGVHPDDLARCNEATVRALRDEAAYDIEFRVRWANGTTRNVKATGQVIRDAQGKPVRMIGINQDITERTRADAELTRHREHLEELVRERTAELERQNLRNELILGTTLDGFFAADQAGHIRVANAAFCRMLGYTQPQLLQLTLADIEANEKPHEIAAHIEHVIATGHDRFDTRHRRKDGSLVDIEISVNLVEIGGERMFYAFARDITSRIESEQALTAARDEAERASNAKSEFLARMSHELRTPMNAILGFSQVLEMEPLNAEQLDSVLEIHRAGDHLLELINELLDISRIDAGRLAVAIRPTTVGPLVKEAIQLVKPLLLQKDITLIDQCPGDATVLADATRLKQILINLLSNAAKYNRAGGSVRLDCNAIGEDLLRISVTDTGPGIAPEKLASLFTPFERLGAEFTEVEGSGIGLALSRKLAELMAGTIDVSSTPGQGTTFWIDLPRGDASASAPHTPDSADRASIDGHKVLYIEDNAANLKVVEAMLRHQPSIMLLSATTGEYGLELAQRHLPDVILLDIHLPGLDGYAVLRLLGENADTRSIPVIALTADALPIDIERGLATGFQRYLTKPVKRTELIKAISEVLEKGA